MNKLYGKYRGQVIRVDDPEMRGRVLVKVSSLLGNNELGWAESCFPPGMFSLPKKGDFVWVEFEEGNIQKPVWTGIMPTREYVKNRLLSDYNTDQALFTTGTNSIILDERGQVLKIVGRTIQQVEG